MESIGTALRRTILLVMLAAGIGAALAWRQSQATTPTPAAAPVWPPLPSREPDPAPGAATKPEPSPQPDTVWVSADVDGAAPATHPVKAKNSSGIFHLPGGRFYDRTKPDRCYPTAAAAEADGYRRSKS
jgi:hypothetical protein